MTTKVVIALPAFNEEENLSQLLQKALQLKDFFGEALSILVLNDGSTDKTETILQEFANQDSQLTYMNHEENKGLGAAINTLISYIIANFHDEDIVVTIDADNTHNPRIIPSLVDKLANNRLDVVIASRFVKGGEEIGVSTLRKLYSRGAKLFFKVFFPIPHINDYSCGFRAYRVGYLRKAYNMYEGHLITSRGFESMAEILARFSKIGVLADEYPLVLEYDLKKGESKMKIIETILGYVKLLKKVRKPKAM